jgi:hypothetical protein
MTSCDFDFAIRSLRQKIDFVEIEHDFIPLRIRVNEVNQSGHELEEMDNRLKRPAVHKPPAQRRPGAGH